VGAQHSAVPGQETAQSGVNTFFVLILIVLPVVGAAIAWLGDVIGYRLGRARRTLFGLRPRLTARLIGVVVGAVLPLLGLAVAAAGSEQVRLALLHLQDLRAQAARLAAANERLVQTEASLRGQVRQMQRRVADAQAQRRAAEQATQQARLRLAEVAARFAGAQTQIHQARARLAALGQQREALQRQVDDLRKERQLLQQQLHKAQQLSQDLEAQRQSLENQLRSTQAELAKAEAERRTAAEEVSRLQTEQGRLGAELADLTRQREDLDRQISKLQRDLSDSEEELARQREKLQEAEQRITAAREYLAQLTAEFTRRLEEQRVIEESPVVYEPGEEIVRAEIPGRQQRDQLKAALSELMVVANAAAIRRGVAPDATGRALVLVRPLPPRATFGERLAAEDIIAGLADRLAESGEEAFIVVVRALARHFLLEPGGLPVELWATPDKVRFRRGEILERLRFPPRCPRAEVLQRILATRPRLREAARARGLLPDPKTGEYGGFSAEELLRAVDKITRSGRPVELRLVAADAVRTAAPLTIALEVHSLRE
jgi:uncharacterized protein (DUF3084 family)